eukprot:2343037-Rhodomonas_salina.2
MAPPDVLGVRIGCFDQVLVSTYSRDQDVCSAPTQRVCTKSLSPVYPLVWPAALLYGLRP